MTAHVPDVSTFLLICLFDVRERRFYPSFASWRPWPGPEANQGLQRWQSRGNHTTGFDALEQARASMTDLAVQLGGLPENNVWSNRFLPFDTAGDRDPRYVLLVSDAGEVANYKFYAPDELPSLQPVDDESLTLSDPDRT